MVFHSTRIEKFIPKTDLLAIRWSIWTFINCVVNIIALMNNQYYTSNWGKNVEEIDESLTYCPKNIKNRIETLSYTKDKKYIIKTLQDILEEIHDLIKQKYVKLNLQKKNTEKVRLSEEFIEIKEYINKIKSACDEKNILKLSYAITELQVWINEILSPIEVILGILNYTEETAKYYSKKYNLPDFTELLSEKDFNEINKEIGNFERKIHEKINESRISIREFKIEKELIEYLKN